jgi:16S rRNA (cytosine967-C5)-methyltransferase
MIYLDRIPAFAAINTAVEMSKSFSKPWVVRFVNGLLRNAARSYESIPFPDFEKDPVAALTVGKSFPKWLIQRWVKRLGPDETALLCDAINTIPPITVRANVLKTSREQLAQAIESDVQEIRLTEYVPEGICLSGLKASVPEMAAFANGQFQVQDEAAQLVTHLLNPRPGETILDACAGLGGKTGHIAQMMGNTGQLIAADSDARKLSKLRAEMKRLGISIVSTETHDLNTPAGVSTFDRVLLDAPCSGLGVLRRNPDTKWQVSKKNLGRYQARQIRFLENLASLVRPSGILVYAVCSTEPEENEAVVRSFLDKHPAFEVEKNPPGLPDKARCFLNSEGFLRTFPHLSGMDGFFAVGLKRKV